MIDQTDIFDLWLDGEEDITGEDVAPEWSPQDFFRAALSMGFYDSSTVTSLVSFVMYSFDEAERRGIPYDVLAPTLLEYGIKHRAGIYDAKGKIWLLNCQTVWSRSSGEPIPVDNVYQLIVQYAKHDILSMLTTSRDLLLLWGAKFVGYQRAAWRRIKKK